MGSNKTVGFSESANIPDDLFVLNPSHQQMISGKNNYGYLWSQYGWRGVFFTLIFVALFGFDLPNLVREVQLLVLATTQAEGHVIEHRISGKRFYYVTYAFTANGQIHSREERVSNT